MNALTKDFTEAVEQQFSKLSADVQDALKKAGTVECVLQELEQKMLRPRGYDGPETKSWGQQFVECDELKAFADLRSRPARFRMDVKTTITGGGTSGGPLGLPAYQDAVNPMPQRRMRIRDLLPVVTISTGAVEYPRQTTRTNAAATVVEGAQKPESALGWTMETVTPKVIAHWVPASRQILEDAPQLRDTIDNELLYGLAYVEEVQLLNGDGTGENLSGLVANATAFADPLAQAAPTMLDTLAAAILQNALAEEPADAIVVHPSDWMRMRLLKDAEAQYVLGAPASSVPPMLFGLPVVATQAMQVDRFLVGNFRRAATLYDRWTPRVEVSTEHADFFTSNKVAILAEERIALAPKNSAALTFGDFGNAA